MMKFRTHPDPYCLNKYLRLLVNGQGLFCSFGMMNMIQNAGENVCYQVMKRQTTCACYVCLFRFSYAYKQNMKHLQSTRTMQNMANLAEWFAMRIFCQPENKGNAISALWGIYSVNVNVLFNCKLRESRWCKVRSQRSDHKSRVIN